MLQVCRNKAGCGKASFQHQALDGVHQHSHLGPGRSYILSTKQTHAVAATLQSVAATPRKAVTGWKKVAPMLDTRQPGTPRGAPAAFAHEVHSRVELCESKQFKHTTFQAGRIDVGPRTHSYKSEQDSSTPQASCLPGLKWCFMRPSDPMVPSPCPLSLQERTCHFSQREFDLDLRRESAAQLSKQLSVACGCRIALCPCCSGRSSFAVGAGRYVSVGQATAVLLVCFDC